MHNVFHAQPIVEKLPLKITCVDSYENHIVVGADNGSLLLYNVEEEPSFTINLVETRVGSTSKPVDAICILNGTDSVAVLSAGAVRIHRISTLELIVSLDSIKGALCIGSPKPAENDAETTTSSQFAVTSKNRLWIWTFDGRDAKSEKELALPDRTRSITWSHSPDVLFLGYTRSVSRVDISTGTITDVHSFRTSIAGAIGSFAPMKQAAVLVDVLSEDRLLVTKDETTIVVQENGTVVHDVEIGWSAPPYVVGNSYVAHVGGVQHLTIVGFAAPWPPFVVALLPRHVEVRALQRNVVVQTLPLPGVNTVVFGHSILAASPTSIWRLLPVDFEDQIEQLLGNDEYADAQSLVEELAFPTEQDKIANVIRIRGMYAHHLFRAEHKYQEGLSILQELNASPLDVINLFPEFAPPDPDASSEPVQPSDRNAIMLLLTYLTEQRGVLSRLRQQQEAYAKSVMGSASQAATTNIADTVYLSEVVDTTLLKVYLQVNEALVGPLLRVTNHCNVSESESLLLHREKFDELISLYRTKGLHRKALEFLKTKATSPEATAAETEKMVQYLHALNMESNLDLILEYAAWILSKDRKEGMKIFTEHYDELSLDTKKRIAAFLLDVDEDFAMGYLEYLVHETKEVDAGIQESLLLIYLSRLRRELGARTGLAGPMVPSRDGAEGSGKSFWDIRRKLTKMLETSTTYRPEKILDALPADALYEEKAIVLSRLKRHEEALRIYIEKVRNYRMANLYCEKHYDPSDPQSRDVFLLLLQLYLSLLSKNEFPLPEILSFMTIYGASIDAIRAMAILPQTIPLTDLLGYFERNMHDTHRTRNTNEVVKNLLKAECIQFKSRLSHHTSVRIPVTDERMCSICLKRIANSVFTRFPDGVIVHAYCASRQ
ncbi:vacuolar sorting protein 39 domain 2-domain-containing protein [Fimicolochytrium jonesii]|uniref:vacuolar sorting protein 39 domain 2-domain-containing protein n=1 Tax=Fimicolochytrium jonesii TaxID=1396493 RepID=UPI0022FDBC5A|nr:vacuolar sorting protein 39 domain 2-domain-containing protein [Fimicolochytrium jonesii]KAI8823117.1 vacuolar sorting protein 39 domain 2-domain-containing protein [Fimicolochytrium jonesii]